MKTIWAPTSADHRFPAIPASWTPACRCHPAWSMRLALEELRMPATTPSPWSQTLQWWPRPILLHRRALRKKSRGQRRLRAWARCPRATTARLRSSSALVASTAKRSPGSRTRATSAALPIPQTLRTLRRARRRASQCSEATWPAQAQISPTKMTVPTARSNRQALIPEERMRKPPALIGCHCIGSWMIHASTMWLRLPGWRRWWWCQGRALRWQRAGADVGAIATALLVGWALPRIWFLPCWRRGWPTVVGFGDCYSNEADEGELIEKLLLREAQTSTSPPNVGVLSKILFTLLSSTF